MNTEKELIKEIERCLICGKKERLTTHHVPYEIGNLRLCRNCHDIVEEAKVYVNRMKSMKKAFKKGEENYKEMINDKLNPDLVYPKDVFPELTKDELNDINNMLYAWKKMQLDRLSAHIGRRLLGNLRKEIIG